MKKGEILGKLLSRPLQFCPRLERICEFVDQSKCCYDFGWLTVNCPKKRNLQKRTQKDRSRKSKWTPLL